MTTHCDHLADYVSERKTSLGFALLISLLILAASGKSVLYDTLDPDAFWHLRVAEQLERDGIGPIVDELSFSSIRDPWTPYSWLAELAMKRAWDIGGYRAAVVMQSCAVAAMFAFIALACVERCREPRPYLGIALSVMFAAYLALPYLSFRPVTLAFAGLALVTWLIQRDRARAHHSRAVWLLPLITVVLINVHLFAMFVPILCACEAGGALCEVRRTRGTPLRLAADRRLRRAVLLLVCTSLACLATPMLPGMMRAITNYGTRDPMVAASVIAELLPFYRGSSAVPILVLLTVAAGLLIRHRGTFDLAEWLALFVGAVAFLRMGRTAPFFVLCAAPMLAASMPGLRGRVLARPGVVGALGVLLLIGGWQLVRAFPGRGTSLRAWLNRHGPDAPGYPSGAAEFIARNVPPVHGKLINDFNWGGYLAFELGPMYRVYMDARTQLFTPGFWQETCLGTSEQLRTALTGVQADAAVIPRRSDRFGTALHALGWRCVYEDARARVLVPGNSPLADVR